MAFKHRMDPYLVEIHFQKLHEVLDGRFAAVYFNAPKVLEAEAQGLDVVLGALGHVRDISISTELSRRAAELVNRVIDRLVPGEVTNRCHNLHMALLMFLDQIGYPAVQAIGLVNAEDPQGRGFVLNPAQSPTAIYTPGHSWLITPEYWVLDISLCHQRDTGDEYEELKIHLPKAIRIPEKLHTEPPMRWWRLPGQKVSNLNQETYSYETSLLNITGWSLFENESILSRYVPTKLRLPEARELEEITNIQIGGLDPARFFHRYLQDLA